MRTDPAGYQANAWLARSFALDGKPEDMAAAETFAQRSLDHMPQFPWWHFGEHRRAKNYFTMACLTRGFAQWRQGRPADAEASFRQCTDEEGVRLDLDVMKSESAGQRAQAERDLETLSGDGAYTGASVNLAMLYEQDRRYEDAEAVLAKTLERDPFFPDAMENYLQILLLEQSGTPTARGDAARDKGLRYCRTWIAPMVSGQLPRLARPLTLEYCARQESMAPQADVVRTVGYLAGAWDHGPGPQAAVTLNQAAKVCAGVHPVLDADQAVAMEKSFQQLAAWLRQAGLTDKAEMCASAAAAAPQATLPLSAPALLHPVMQAAPPRSADAARGAQDRMTAKH